MTDHKHPSFLPRFVFVYPLASTFLQEEETVKDEAEVIEKSSLQSVDSKWEKAVSFTFPQNSETLLQS